MISRPRRTDMLAASRLISVSILAPSWSLSEQDRTNVRPTSVPKPRLCPSTFGGHTVDFQMRCSALSPHRMGAYASRFSTGQSCLPVPSRRHHQTCAWGSESWGRGAKPPQATSCVKSERSEDLYAQDVCLRQFPFLRNLRMTQKRHISSIYKEDFSHE